MDGSAKVNRSVTPPVFGGTKTFNSQRQLAEAACANMNMGWHNIVYQSKIRFEEETVKTSTILSL